MHMVHYVEIIMNEIESGSSNPAAPPSLDVARAALLRDFPLQTFLAAVDPSTPERTLWRLARAQGSRMLMQEFDIAAAQADALLVEPSGGTAKRRARRLSEALRAGPTAEDIVDAIVKQRQRGGADSHRYLFRNQLFPTDRALFEHLQEQCGLTLGYRTFCSRLNAYKADRPVDAATRAVAIDEAFVSSCERRPNVGAANVETHPVRVVDTAGQVLGTYRNGRRLREAAAGLLQEAPAQSASERQFARNFRALCTAKRADADGVLAITLDELAGLVGPLPKTLPCDALLQRIDAYQQEHHVALAISREDACTRYVGKQTKLPWRCLTDPGHGVYDKAVDKLDQGCPGCSEEGRLAQRRRPGYDNARRYIEEVVGGRLVTPFEEYKSCRQALSIVDKDGIPYRRSMDSLRRNPFLVPKSAMELCMRLILWHATGYEFRNAKPAFLRGLEYDNYCAELNLNVECDGVQHHKFTRKFHRTEADFRHQQERDRRKDALSRDHGIRNLRAPYTLFPFADEEAADRHVDDAVIIQNVCAFLAEQKIGIDLLPTSEVIAALAGKLVAAVNARSHQRCKQLCQQRNGHLLEIRDRRVRYHCHFCQAVHKQGVSNLMTGHVAAACKHAAVVRALLAAQT